MRKAVPDEFAQAIWDHRFRGARDRTIAEQEPHHGTARLRVAPLRRVRELPTVVIDAEELQDVRERVRDVARPFLEDEDSTPFLPNTRRYRATCRLYRPVVGASTAMSGSPWCASPRWISCMNVPMAGRLLRIMR
jgi:hypothetical protein